MTRRLVASPEAKAQIDAIDTWWRSNRAASPDLFAQELAEDSKATSDDLNALAAHAHRVSIERV